MRIGLVINAEQPAVEKLREVVGALREAGHEVHPRLTFEAADATRQAREAAELGCELVVSAGGDGTLNEVVNGLHEHALAAGGGGRVPRLGVIPLGTANDFAGGLQIPADIPLAMDVAVRGRARPVDVAMVNDRCFINVSTAGFGAEATEETSDEVKNALGPLAYVITGVRKFATLEPSEARFSDGEPIHAGRFLLFALGNGGRTGGGNWLTPRADLADGKLDLCIVTEMSRVDFVKLLPDLRAGTHLGHPGVIYRQVERVEIDSVEELSVNADGEPLSARRLLYRMSPLRLEVMVPA